MSTRYETNAMPYTLLTSPLMTFFTLLSAVVIGSSLLEFNELLFPPKVTSVSFWALLPVYIVAIDGWFGVVAWAREVPYADTPVLRTTILLLVIVWITLLALMFFASRVPDTLLSYLWGLVVLFVLTTLHCVLRYHATKNPQPFAANMVPGIFALATAIAYSIWLFAFYPVPDVINWVFVAIAFAILAGMRVWMKVTHAWRPEEKRARGEINA